MLKLKYLFDNRDLAIMLLKNWNYDNDSLELFEHFRISSNAIYPFKNQKQLYFLRFVPESEKEVTSIQEELKFIELLSRHGFNVSKGIESKFGNLIETKDTPWGKYHAVVFEGVGNKTLEELTMTVEIAYQYGGSLARLHQISQNKIRSTISRKSVFDIFDMIEKSVEDTGQPLKLSSYIKQLRLKFEEIERTEYSFGLIHYDFELDNILYDVVERKLFAIDFDDCMYGFYGQDVERSINSIESEVDESLQESAKSSFINGYLDAGGKLDVYREHRELFRAFADMYAYFRIGASLEEQWDNEPLWMENLRNRLGERMKAYLAKI